MSSTSPHTCRRFDAPLSIAFVFALAAPWIDTLVRSDPARGPERELRPAAERPALPRTLADLAAFPERYDAHFRDSFGLRDQLLHWHSALASLVFGVSPSDQVIWGKDHWVFYTGSHALEVHRGLMPLSNEELESWRRKLELRRDYLRERGADYLLALAPSKEVIYPELVPASYNRLGPTRLDQFVEYMRAHSDVPVLDFRPILFEAKRDDRQGDYTYYPLGTHWNGRGSYVCYREMVERLKRHTPMPAALELSDLERIVHAHDGDSWSERMYIGDLLRQVSFEYLPPEPLRARFVATPLFQAGREVHYSQRAAELPTGLMFHDSFGNHLQALLAQHFRDLLCIWTADFDAARVEELEPDVVIDVYVDRVLVTAPPFEPKPRAVPTPVRAAFDRSTRTLYRMDPCSDATGPWNGAGYALERGDDREPALRARKTAADGFLVLPALARCDATTLHLDIESSTPTTLNVLYRRAGDRTYRRKQMRSAPVPSGRRQVYLQLDVPDLDGPLLLLLGETDSEFRLHALEARAVERSDETLH